jgi:predicted transcriptional regulator
LEMRTVTIKLDDELKRKMKTVTINWSEYIRRAIAERVNRETRKEAATKLLNDLRRGGHRVPKGFVNATIRKGREER